MAELLENLGIDWKLLFANTLTFFLVLWILRKFAYRPILGVLEKRQQTVADSLEKAKQATKEFEKLQHEKDALLKDAKEQAQALVRDAEQQAETVRQQKLDQTMDEANQLVDRTRQQLEREQAQMLSDAKGELARLVVTSTAKLIEAEDDKATEARLQKKAAQALKEIGS